MKLHHYTIIIAYLYLTSVQLSWLSPSRIRPSITICVVVYCFLEKIGTHERIVRRVVVQWQPKTFYFWHQNIIIFFIVTSLYYSLFSSVNGYHVRSHLSGSLHHHYIDTGSYTPSNFCPRSIHRSLNDEIENKYINIKKADMPGLLISVSVPLVYRL